MTSAESPRMNLLPEGYSYHPEGYLWYVLPAEKFNELPQGVDINGEMFFKKNEFHVTVINARKLATTIHDSGNGGDIDALEKQIQALLTEYLQQHTIAFVSFQDDLRLAISPDRKSIAARCTMSGIEGYFEYLQSKFGVTAQEQPTHVSIYTVTGAAVGIDTVEQMESFEEVDLPEVQKTLDTISA